MNLSSGGWFVGDDDGGGPAGGVYLVGVAIFRCLDWLDGWLYWRAVECIE